VINVFIGLLGVLISTNQPGGASHLSAQTNGITVSVIDTNDPVQKEYQKLVDDDEAALAEVDQWITENREFAAKGAAAPNADLNRRIRERFDPVRKAYEEFISRHPAHSKARVAFASFLGDIGDEDEEQTQLEKALELEKKDPAIYNNLANIYGHHGPVTNAFDFYQKAIDLNPLEPVYYHNFGTTVFLFRVDAREYYGITEQQVFDKALALYDKGLKLDPTDFPLASDVAQTYYGIKPNRTEDALRAWTNALSVAHDEIEREGVYAHFARIKLHDGRFAEARAHLNAITNAAYDDLKNRLTRNLDEAEKKARETNAAPVSPAQGTNAASNAPASTKPPTAKIEDGK